ncbi:type IV pilus modification PilV family protein [Anaerocolumna sp. MB42-C2]|uniref:type IV pilus modification PilV family protein n=1 Tax=Anaerocolumna sp. MB42-C2 TaxID=3070997 RepID=UPI0027DEAEE5|nr:prepilin-type N-terminal cleavage/methylation domain-containing protein [Anaerocolumna sp. MB42-C2]WMJ88590.1 prepilin-type N-terminal cleavage/methylation domain-containing protein [Anaerocolumna sp. MB42-C2]
MEQKKLSNAGFTLIEALLCIAVLGLLIVPLLGSFVTTAKVNVIGKKNQKATVLAGNIMESIQAMTLEETALQFNNAELFQIINSNLNGYSTGNYQLKDYSQDGYGEYYTYGDGIYQKITEVTSPRSSVLTVLGDGTTHNHIFNPPENRTSFVFGVQNLLDGETGYDALITLDTSVYSDRIKYDDTMNNYKMPSLSELNENTVAILDLEGINTTWSDDSENAEPTGHISTDEQAILDFYNIYLSHRALADSQSEDTDPIGMDEIKDKITKDIEVYLTKDDTLKQVMVECRITYRCGLDLNENGETEKLPQVNLISGVYPYFPDSNYQCQVYMFYTPSQFIDRDSIRIQNDSVDAAIYIANQNEKADTRVTIRKEEINNPITTLYTNLKSYQLDVNFPVDDYNLITKTEDSDRVYTITVSIYPAGAIQSGQLTKTYAVLTSAKEE